MADPLLNDVPVHDRTRGVTLGELVIILLLYELLPATIPAVRRNRLEDLIERLLTRRR